MPKKTKACPQVDSPSRPASWGSGLGGASTHFIQTFKNAFSSRNLDHMCLKMYIFWKKSLKSPKSRVLSTRTPVGLRQLRVPPPDPHVVTPVY